ncbi:TetR/AcrR family transcriptional regulator [Kutzneria kofuensis]|uniref:AcrR family transcriptional regulator n=1 Tax=Kutzneria kofuensis TaxID=103725 RepID=A0A7W9KEP8_9PSEU|nr:TetR/AcrR family transcriptional regulator [Kutzneria kofuensis]MBB5891161.1 AcrR family transcriptional regulator [Kutzneria kofuensis]
MSSPSRRRVPLDTPERLAEVLAAAIDVVAEVGYERFNMDLVAQRAHVSKGSLYQRWPSKAHLIVAALDANRVEMTAPDTGSYLGDVRELAKRWLRAEMPGDRRGLLLALLEGSRRDPELARLMTEQLGQGGTNPMAEVLDAAKARGELPPGVDLELLAELPLSLAITNVLFKDQPLTEDLVDRIVDGLLAPLLGIGDHRE